MNTNTLINSVLKENRDIQNDLAVCSYLKIKNLVIPKWKVEFESLTLQNCIEYIHNLTINYSYDANRTEIETIYGQLEEAVQNKIEPAPDKWDRTYSVDFYLQIGKNFIGIQIKPVASGQSLNDYQWIEMHKTNHEKFEKEFGGKVFFVYSTKNTAGKKKIYNIEVIEKIKDEIKRLKDLQ